MLTFYLVVTAFLTGIAASHRSGDLWWAVEQGDDEAKLWAWGVIFGVVALIVLWPVCMLMAVGTWIANYYKINLNGFKRP